MSVDRDILPGIFLQFHLLVCMGQVNLSEEFPCSKGSKNFYQALEVDTGPPTKQG